MTIPLDRILTCSLEGFLAMQDEHFQKEKYMPVGVYYEHWGGGENILKRFAEKVPNDALVVVAYSQFAIKERPDYAHGTALVPKRR